MTTRHIVVAAALLAAAFVTSAVCGYTTARSKERQRLHRAMEDSKQADLAASSWRVTGQTDLGNLVLQAAGHTIEFAWDGVEWHKGAYAMIVRDRIDWGWSIRPTSVERRGGRTYISGVARQAGRDIAGDLKARGVLRPRHSHST